MPSTITFSADCRPCMTLGLLFSSLLLFNGWDFYSVFLGPMIQCTIASASDIQTNLDSETQQRPHQHSTNMFLFSLCCSMEKLSEGFQPNRQCLQDFKRKKRKQHQPWSLTGTLNVLKANNNWAVPCEKLFERIGKVYRPGSDISFQVWKWTIHEGPYVFARLELFFFALD